MFRNNQRGGRVVVVVDLWAGSGGKGALNSWLADKHGFHLATDNWMTNAGHYTELDDGTRILVQHIPSAFIDRNVELYINPGAALDLEVFAKEVEMLDRAGYDVSNRLRIHPHANVIVKEDKELERRTIKSGSTFKGCGASVAGKALRAGRRLAKDYDQLQPFIKDMTEEINEGVAKGMRILVEGSQGMDLDVNHAEFPYVTSRQTNPAQLVADAGLPCQAVTNVVANVRTNPIRINNRSAANPGETCYTGNYWDAREITWQQVAEQAGWSSFEEFEHRHEKALMTSVTLMRRRVFEFPRKRFKYLHAMCGGLLGDGSLLYSINFINFVDRRVEGVTDKEALMTDKVRKWLEENFLPTAHASSLKWIRTGARHSQIVELPDGIPA